MLIPKTSETPACIACGGNLATETENWACASCSRRYPPALIKSVGDEFDYALRLRTGEVIHFRKASLHGDFATLTLIGETIGRQWNDELAFSFPRGVEVRIEDIVWCADAPNGS